MNLFYGFLMGALSQILTFLQLQGSAKWGWYEKHPLFVLLFSVPITWISLQSVNTFINEYNGSLWPARFLGFGIGILVFSFMSYILFDEGLSAKTIICLLLSTSIILIQIYWK